jgi:drug/metabolite transporter (DMT)-like permease
VRAFVLVMAFVVLAAIWGGAFVAIKISVHSFPPISAAAIRLVIATLFVYLLYRGMGHSVRLPKGALWRVWLAGLFTIGFPFALVFWGEQSIPAGLAGVINGTVPIWTTCTLFVMHAWDGRAKQYRPKVWAGVLLGFAGMLVIFYPQLEPSGSQTEFWGTLAVVGMALCYAISNVMNGFIMKSDRKKGSISIPANIVHQHFISMVFLVALAAALEPSPLQWWEQAQWQGWVAVVFLAIISGATALMIYYWLIRELGSIRTAAVTYLIPVASLGLDYAMLGTVPGSFELLGTLVILLGVFFIQSAPKN